MSLQAHSSTHNITRRYLDTPKFMELYRDVMTTVENTANYLDTQGRVERRALSRFTEIFYSKTTMQLTSQLMQIAGHALVLRDVCERKLDIEEALSKIKQSRTFRNVVWDRDEIKCLPAGFVDLCDAAARLHTRLEWIVDGLSRDGGETSDQENKVHSNLALLRQVFA